LKQSTFRVDDASRDQIITFLVCNVIDMKVNESIYKDVLPEYSMIHDIVLLDFISMKHKHRKILKQYIDI